MQLMYWASQYGASLRSNSRMRVERISRPSNQSYTIRKIIAYGLLWFLAVPPPLYNTGASRFALGADVWHCDVELCLVYWDLCRRTRIYRKVKELVADHSIGSCINYWNIRSAGMLCLNIHLDWHDLTRREILNICSIVVELETLQRLTSHEVGSKSFWEAPICMSCSMSRYSFDWRLLVTCWPHTAFMASPAERAVGEVMMPCPAAKVANARGKKDECIIEEGRLERGIFDEKMACEE